MAGPALLSPATPISGTGATVLDFWQWAYSDMLSNRNRGLLAEFLVGTALGVTECPRVEWDAVDLRYCGHGIEVKSSAYLQSWPQRRPSRICWSIRKSLAWDAATGEYAATAGRTADAYVFCLYTERDRAKCNVLDVAAWEFYVVPTAVIDQGFGDRTSVALGDVQAAAAACGFAGLKAAVDEAVKSITDVL